MIRSTIKIFQRRLPGVPVRLCLVAGVLLHLCAAWFTEGYLHPDEHFQILEFANYKLGKSPGSDLAWEFRSEIRPSLQPLLAAATYRAASWCGMSSPFFVAFVLRLFTALAAWLLTLALCIAAFRWLKHGFLKKIVFLFSCFFFYLPYLHCRFASENLSGIMFFAGLAAVLFNDFAAENTGLPPRRNIKTFIIMGLLLGLSFFFRFQTGFAIAGIGAWLLLIRRTSPKELLWMAAAFCFICFINMGFDRWFYGHWVLTPLNYFKVNILDGAAKNCGASPWWYYFVELLGDLLPPLSVLFLAGVVLSCVKCYRNPLVWAVAPFFVAHCIISHKETRFLLPMLYALPLLVALGADSLRPPAFARLKKAASSKAFKRTAWSFALINAVLLAVFTFKPAKEVVGVYKWLYHENARQPLTLLTLKTTPYTLVEVPVNFYRPPLLRLDTVRCAADLVRKTQQAARPLHIFIEDLLPPDSLTRNEALTWKVECRSIPSWLEHFNIDNWLSRIHVWSVFSVSRKVP